MKNLHIFLFAALYVVTCTQFISAQNISIGLRVGVGMSSFLGDVGKEVRVVVNEGEGPVVTEIERSYPLKQAFYGGVAANIGFGEKFSVMPELLYSAQGGNEEIKVALDGGEATTITTVYNIGYFKIPILAKYYVMGEMGNGLSLYAGPHVGFKLSEAGTAKISSEFVTLEIDLKDEDFKGLDKDEKEVDLLNGLDFGVIAGVDYEFEFGLSVGLRYDVGFLTLFNTENVALKNNTFKNQMFSLAIGYMFNLGG